MIKKNLAIAIFAFTTLLQADYVMKYNMDGDITEFMYKDSSTSKMITHSEDKTEIYNIKKNSYIVTHSDDGITVVDVNEMRAKAKAMGFDPSAFAQKQEKPKYTIKKTGKKEKLGGITGKVWIIKGEENGEKYQTKVVVTNDKRVVKTIRAMFNSFSAMSGGMIGSHNLFELQKGYVTIKSDGMKLTSFKERSLSSNTYKIPKVTNTREAFNERNRAKKPKSSQTALKSARYKDKVSCYDTLCCGKVKGESIILKNSAYKYERNFIDSATCKDNEQGKRTEVMLWENSKGDRVHIELHLDVDKSFAKKAINSDRHHGQNNSDFGESGNYKVGKYPAHYVHFRATRQERLDISINDNTVLTLTRLYDRNKPYKYRALNHWPRSLEGWANKGNIHVMSINKHLKKYDHSARIPKKKVKDISRKNSNNRQTKQTPAQREAPAPKQESYNGPSEADLSKAADMLKSFF